MAEVLWNHLAAGSWHAVSAGSNPAGFVHPMAIAVLQDLDLTTDELESKSHEQFADQAFDVVITVCDNAQNDCPFWPNAQKTLHWPFADPADATGDDVEKLRVFREIRDQIKQKISQFLENASTQ